VRENSEGEYCGAGGRIHQGLATEAAVETSVYTRKSVERVARHAFELARKRPAKRVTSITKSNAQRYAGVLWDEVLAEVAAGYEDIEFSSLLVDAATARLVLDPGSLDVLVASNLHADILSDLTAALAGSLGVAPSGNYHLDGRYPSMFEPVHGSAPDITGNGTANPLAAVLSAAMMLEWLGYPSLGAVVRRAVDETCAAGITTPDLGGQGTTTDVAQMLARTIRTAEAAVSPRQNAL
jgi:tartrate dehydrogenase/decarboxylase/D-malate dehydrogenase